MHTPISESLICHISIICISYASYRVLRNYSLHVVGFRFVPRSALRYFIV